MASLANITRMENPAMPFMEILKGTVTTSGDTYTSIKFKTIVAVQISDRTTLGGARVSAISNGQITITCTNGDVVDLTIFGYM